MEITNRNEEVAASGKTDMRTEEEQTDEREQTEEQAEFPFSAESEEKNRRTSRQKKGKTE